MQIEQLGPYKIGKRLGKGGMGSVYAAVDSQSGQHVAVKALSPQLAAAEGFRERFEAEIDSLKKLQHDSIVRLYGYGEQDGILFYSMELVDGTSLEEELKAGRRFDWHETVDIAVQICRALKHAHDHGVVHRDIKPANLLLGAGDRIKIADFGIARLFGGTQLTTAGGVLGTADYMSPEQADGRPVTEKCDQYSLGGVMYALLAGRPPFRAKTMPEMLQLQRFAEPEPLRRLVSDTPEQLERLIHQLLAKEPADRFPNVMVLGRHMEAMAKALSRPVRQEPTAQCNLSEGSGIDLLSDVTNEAFDLSTREEGQAKDISPLFPTGAANLPSQIFDAPTVADRSAEQSAGDSPSTPTEAPKTPAATDHFTTVDADKARRQRQQTRHERIVLATQLAGLITALSLLVWSGWWLTRPASADDLYAQIMTTIQENGTEDLRVIEGPLEEFTDRFGTDPRLSEFEHYREELELQKMERKLKFKAAFGGSHEISLVQWLYTEAHAAAGDSPERSQVMLSSLLALYGPAVSNGPAVSDGLLSEDDRRWLVLARRQLDRLNTQIEKQAANQLPALRERLETAIKLQKTNPAAAQRMVKAIVDLYDEKPWAKEIVKQARSNIQE